MEQHCSLTAFHATVLFLYLLKTSENQRFCKVFRGYRKKTVAQSWLLIGEFESYFRGYLKKINFSQRAVLINFAFFKSSFWIYHLYSIYILKYSYIIIIYIFISIYLRAIRVSISAKNIRTLWKKCTSTCYP